MFWWYFIHDDPDTVGRRGLRRLQRAAADGRGVPTSAEGAAPDDGTLPSTPVEDEDPDLTAYNAYLAALAEEDRPKSWRAR